MGTVVNLHAEDDDHLADAYSFLESTRALEPRYVEEEWITKARYVGQRYLEEKRELVRTGHETSEDINYAAKKSYVKGRQRSRELLSRIDPEDTELFEQCAKFFDYLDKELGYSQSQIFKIADTEIHRLLTHSFLPQGVLAPKQQKREPEEIVETIPITFRDWWNREKTITYYR